MENQNDAGKIIGAALIGAAVGVALGILLAPDKGSETRKKIINGIKDLADELKEAMKEREDDVEADNDANTKA